MKIKAAAMLMTLILAAGSVTACAEKTNGSRTSSPDTTKKSAEAPVDETVPETENRPVVETVYTDDGSRRYATDYPIELKEQKRAILILYYAVFGYKIAKRSKNMLKMHKK